MPIQGQFFQIIIRNHRPFLNRGYRRHHLDQRLSFNSDRGTTRRRCLQRRRIRRRKRKFQRQLHSQSLEPEASRLLSTI